MSWVRIAFAVLVVGGAGAQVFTSQESEKLLDAVNRFEKLAAKNPELWPGFLLTEVPLVVYRPEGRALVIGHPTPPAGRSVKTSGRAARFVAAPEGWYGSSPASLDGVSCGRLEVRTLSEKETVASLMSRMVAAAFRAYQGRTTEGSKIGWTVSRAAAFDYPADNAENDAAVEVESLLLDNLGTDPAGRPDRARDLASLHAARRAKLEKKARLFEDRFAAAVALPSYIEVRALAVATKARLVSEAEAAAVTQTIVGVRTGPVAERLRVVIVRGLLLLDEIGASWQAAVGEGKSVADAMVMTTRGRAGRAAQVRKRLGFSAVLGEAKKRLEKKWREHEVEWGRVDVAGGRGAVIVDLSPFPDMGAQQIELATAKRIDSKRRLHQRLRVALGDSGLLVYARGVAEDRDTKRYVARLPRDGNVQVKVDGQLLRLDLTTTKLFLEADIHAHGTRLRVHGGLIHVANGGVRVRPFPRGVAKALK